MAGDVKKILQVTDLRIEFHTFGGTIHAVNGLSFSVDKGEILGIVGESGCGKSVATHAILQLVPMPPGKIVQGQIFFQSQDKPQDLLQLSENQINQIRGKDVAMIFQEPMTSLNPVLTIENQITEGLRIHFPGDTEANYRKKAIEALKAVGIPEPESRLQSYPHNLSGGMRQRVMIAMALACQPKLLIADEPTTALDVTIQAQILEILLRMKREYGMSVILITHNLGVVAETADRVAVMYAGEIVEQATAKDIFENPKHPYTLGLLKSLPSYSDFESEIESKSQSKSKSNSDLDSNSDELNFSLHQRLSTIKGMVPDLKEFPKLCPFKNRCTFAFDECETSKPSLKEVSQGHFARCFKSDLDAKAYSEIGTKIGTKVTI